MVAVRFLTAGFRCITEDDSFDRDSMEHWMTMDVPQGIKTGLESREFLTKKVLANYFGSAGGAGLR